VRPSDGQGWLQNRWCVKWTVMHSCCILIYASMFNEIYVHPFSYVLSFIACLKSGLPIHIALICSNLFACIHKNPSSLNINFTLISGSGMRLWSVIFYIWKRHHRWAMVMRATMIFTGLVVRCYCKFALWTDYIVRLCIMICYV
jgi:hypothetical protein